VAHSTVSGGRSDRRSSAGLPTSRAPFSLFNARGDRPRRILALATHPVAAATALAAVLHLLWLTLLANGGGDLAAQDAWAAFASAHPSSAYDLAWYGGMSPASYSAISPYVMAALGVRTTTVLAGTVSAALLALLIVRSNRLTHPLPVALYGAVALTGNAVSGRTTFGLGLMFGLASLAVIFAWPEAWRSTTAHRTAQLVLAGLLAALATASSPLAGLFVGLAAVAMWFSGRRSPAYTLGLPPLVLVLVSAWLFPFSGVDPMATASLIRTGLSAVLVAVLAPREWRAIRIAAVLYAAAVVLAWLVPSEIGSNIDRLGLLFGGVVLVAIAGRKPHQGQSALARLGVRLAGATLVIGIGILSIWQVDVAANDPLRSTPTASWSLRLHPLVHQLETRDAKLGRVEVVPTRSHREASALVPYVNLARGWNRQADTARNPIFYNHTLTATTYHAWLNRWAVRYVVLPSGPLDFAGTGEAALVTTRPPYLREVWADAAWQLYAVADPTPLATPHAVVIRFGASEAVLRIASPGRVLVRIPYSPWLSLIDGHGNALEAPESEMTGVLPINVNGCLSQREQPAGFGQPTEQWTVLHAPKPGVYRIAAPYKLPRGTTCPANMVG
jgi:hypothetical protein